MHYSCCFRFSLTSANTSYLNLCSSNPPLLVLEGFIKVTLTFGLIPVFTMISPVFLTKILPIDFSFLTLLYSDIKVKIVAKVQLHNMKYTIIFLTYTCSHDYQQTRRGCLALFSIICLVIYLCTDNISVWYKT